MHHNLKEENRGASINPSARRSIHQNLSTPNSDIVSDRMGRYGLNRSNTSNDQGVDVVDNVMSKHSHHSSPLPIRHRKVQRANSYTENEDHTEDSSTLSKSLPATLPSRLSYSDESEGEEASYSSSSLRNARLEETSHSQLLNISNQSTDLYRSLSKTNISDNQSGSKLPYVILLTLLIAALAVFYNKFLVISTVQDKSTQTHNHDDVLFDDNMKLLQEKYNIDNNTMLKLKSGISTIFSRMDTGSFMFVYNSNTHHFNSLRFDRFVNEVASVTAKYLRNNVNSIQETIVVSSTLKMRNHGELIQRYRDDLDRTGVLLVKEVDEVPSDLAMAFHYYCDEYDPLVKRSAIFFTLDLDNCTQTSDPKSTHELIEKCLSKKWTTVPIENMRPLLTRIVDVVIDVTSVF